MLLLQMVTLYQDPDGKTVFPTSTQAQGDNSDTRAADSGDESDLTAAKATIDSLRKRVSQLESSMSGTQLEVQVAKSVSIPLLSRSHATQHCEFNASIISMHFTYVHRCLVTLTVMDIERCHSVQVTTTMCEYTQVLKTIHETYNTTYTRFYHAEYRFV